MKKEDIQVDIPDNKNDVEEKEVEKIESKIEERLARKREQVEKLFIEHYNQEEGSEALKKLVDREMASGKSFDKLIKQKKKWRAEAAKKKNQDENKEGDPENENKPKNSLDALREIEKTKATKSFLQNLVNKYPDTFKTKDDIMEAHKKIESEYKESGDETRREDFEKNFEKAFRLSHPDLYEQEIKDKARKELLEDDVDLSNITNKLNGEKKQKNKPKFLKPKMSKDELTDWLLKGETK